VTKAIDLLAKELDVAMALTGTRSVADIDRRVLAPA
jgi:isopentenyl diphosphate isomerase/L-lactate dehydrogenase-like FMN-dependent dehydrogenase